MQNKDINTVEYKKKFYDAMERLNYQIILIQGTKHVTIW